MKKPEEDVIIAKEKATWQAYKEKGNGVVSKHLTFTS